MSGSDLRSFWWSCSVLRGLGRLLGLYGGLMLNRSFRGSSIELMPLLLPADHVEPFSLLPETTTTGAHIHPGKVSRASSPQSAMATPSGRSIFSFYILFNIYLSTRTLGPPSDPYGASYLPSHLSLRLNSDTPTVTTI
jgi:hypothetical protein